MAHVYLIEDDTNNTFKIGLTKGDPNKRLKNLQTGNSSQLKIRYVFDTDYPYRLENMLHKHYQTSNIRSEWFHISDPDNFVTKCNEFSNIIHSLLDNPYFSKNLK